MEVFTIPYMEDNLGYYVHKKGHPDGGVFIDCGDFTAYKKFMAAKSVTPGMLLITHRHYDHSDGNADFKAALPHVKVAAGKIDNVKCADLQLKDEDTLSVSGLKIKALHTPCHTKGHICYYVEVEGGSEEEEKGSEHVNTMDGPYMITSGLQQALFTGDTFFNSTVGRFFEGDAAQM